MRHAAIAVCDIRLRAYFTTLPRRARFCFTRYAHYGRRALALRPSLERLPQADRAQAIPGIEVGRQAARQIHAPAFSVCPAAVSAGKPRAASSAGFFARAGRQGTQAPPDRRFFRVAGARPGRDLVQGAAAAFANPIGVELALLDAGRGYAGAFVFRGRGIVHGEGTGKRTVILP